MSRSTLCMLFGHKSGPFSSLILFPRPLIFEKFGATVDVCYFDLLQCCTIGMEFNMTAVNNIINKYFQGCLHFLK